MDELPGRVTFLYDLGENFERDIRVVNKDGHIIFWCDKAAPDDADVARYRELAKRWNSHDDLMASCKELLVMVKEMLPKHEGGCGWGKLAIEIAEKRIKEAEGETHGK